MSDARQKAIAALQPFAALADELDRAPLPIARPGVAVLAIGDRKITVDDLRQARKIWRELGGTDANG